MQMGFRQAYYLMRKGMKVARKPWQGYWTWENDTIMIYCADGTVLDIRQTDNVDLTIDNILAHDWVIVV